jgi:hypothetical protein
MQKPSCPIPKSSMSSCLMQVSLCKNHNVLFLSPQAYYLSFCLLIIFFLFFLLSADAGVVPPFLFFETIFDLVVLLVCFGAGVTAAWEAHALAAAAPAFFFLFIFAFFSAGVAAAAGEAHVLAAAAPAFFFPLFFGFFGAGFLCFRCARPYSRVLRAISLDRVFVSVRLCKDRWLIV